jgi:hypothetical protein
MSHKGREGTKLKRTFISLAAVVTVTVMLMVPLGQAASLAPEFGRFLGCPGSKTEDSPAEVCVQAVIKKGNLRVGSKNFPVTNPVVLTGGTNFEFENFAFNSKGGIAPIRQRIPGGLASLTGFDWLGGYLGPENLKLYAVIELAGTPILGVENSTLPLKVHLINAALGNGCHLGSQSAPIILNLTIGTTNPPPPNQPISGIEPKLEVDDSAEVLVFKGGKYVDNAFAVPGASGCVLKLPGISPVNINGLVGLPSPGGHNEAVQYLDMEAVESTRAYP